MGRRFLVVATSVALVVAGLVGAATSAAAAARPPVVLIVFDGFPTNSLLNARGRIDATRYPTFARLARDSTWFPNATTSLDETGRAFRSIFTSRTAWRFAKPNYSEHPNNLFTLLGRHYGVVSGEESTSFCPKRLCPDVRPQTKESIESLLANGRPERFADWVERLLPSRRPTFYFKHVLLPHSPWYYLRDGQRYIDGPSERALTWDDWHEIPWLVHQTYQRHLLQVEYTDRLLGTALDKLRAGGLYDRSLIVVTADHGERFGRKGNAREFQRRAASDVALKPFFVKLPRQRAGRIDNRPVRNVDILPTIARVARLRPGWRVEGHPVFGREARRIPRKVVLFKRSGERIELSLKTLRRQAAASLRLKLKLFGRSLFGIGPHPELNGTPVTRWPALPPSALRAELDDAHRYADLPPDLQSPPVKVSGQLTGAGGAPDIAVAVNGTIVATAPTLTVGSRRVFTVLIPESSLQTGSNTVQVLSVEGGRALRPLGGT